MYVPTEGERVQLSPSTDRWMRGDRYALVTRVNNGVVTLKSERTHLRSRVRVQDLLPNPLRPMLSDAAAHYAAAYLIRIRSSSLKARVDAHVAMIAAMEEAERNQELLLTPTLRRHVEWVNEALDEVGLFLQSDGDESRCTVCGAGSEHMECASFDSFGGTTEGYEKCTRCGMSVSWGDLSAVR